MDIRRIDSPDDAALDPFRDVKDRQRRADGGRFLVESPRCVARFLAAVDSGLFEIESLVADPGTNSNLMDVAKGMGASVLAADPEIITRASGYRFHDGCLALGVRPPRPRGVDQLTENRDSKPGSRKVLVVLAGVTSMDNIGGIFRSVAALGAHGVVLDHACADPLLRRCIRISMGQVFRVDWATTPSLPDQLRRWRHEHAFTSIALENLPDARLLTRFARAGGEDGLGGTSPERVAVVIGNEGHGLTPEVMEACDTIRRIEGPPSLPDEERPGASDERSLNAATAAAIAMHHLLHG